MDVPDYYEGVSLKLTRVLDTTGLGEKSLWKRIEMWIQTEKLETEALVRVNHTFLVFGSQVEATIFWGLKSDTDTILRVDLFTVLQDLRSWEPGPRQLLTITDGTTLPGYVELQSVRRDASVPVRILQTGWLMLDRYGGFVLYSAHRLMKSAHSHEHHGPASAFHGKGYSEDQVKALWDPTWPYTAYEWLIRHRKHNWPSQETVSIIQQSGALLVPVGQQLSPERHIEWKISLSYGEKILVLQFNSTQYKCYVLLKMIKKYFIKMKVGDNVLTSYHCKTCMFYVIEGTPATLWQPQNLLVCIDLCLRKLRSWVEEVSCPHYFISAENMFLGKVSGPIQSNMASVLCKLLRRKGKYLTRIPYDKIGWKLVRVCQSLPTETDDENKDGIKSMVLTVAYLVNSLYSTRFRLLADGVLMNPKILERTVSSHVVQQEVSTMLRTFLCSSLGSHLASKCLEQEVTDQEGLDMAYEFLLLGHPRMLPPEN